jgi:DNA-binding Xre family transcriptional regulator
MSGSDRQAWSTLRTLLAEKNLTVVDLHEKLREQGFEMNKKSLYRLAASHPIQKIDTAIARAVCEALNVGLEDLIQFQKPRLELQRLNRRSEKELDRLMDNNNEGKLTEKQRARLKTLLDEVEKSLSTIPKCWWIRRGVVNQSTVRFWLPADGAEDATAGASSGPPM